MVLAKLFLKGLNSSLFRECSKQTLVGTDLNILVTGSADLRR